MKMNSDYGYSDCSNVIIVNGVKRNYAEYKRERRAALAKKRKAKTITWSKQVAAETAATIKAIKVFKSLIAYWKHGYRQWGTIATSIMSLPEIRPHMTNLVVKLRDINQLVETITTAAKKRENVTNDVMRVTYWMDDARELMEQLMSGICKSGALDAFRNHECISGEGKRLGLRILLIKCSDAMPIISKGIKELQTLALQSDPTEYTLQGRRIG